MRANVARLRFLTPDDAAAEADHLASEKSRLEALPGFGHLLVIQTDATELVVVRSADDAAAMQASLGPLRPDLASRFAAAPERSTGEILLAVAGPSSKGEAIAAPEGR